MGTSYVRTCELHKSKTFFHSSFFFFRRRFPNYELINNKKEREKNYFVLNSAKPRGGPYPHVSTSGARHTFPVPPGLSVSSPLLVPFLPSSPPYDLWKFHWIFSISLTTSLFVHFEILQRRLSPTSRHGRLFPSVPGSPRKCSVLLSIDGHVNAWTNNKIRNPYDSRLIRRKPTSTKSRRDVEKDILRSGCTDRSIPLLTIGHLTWHLPRASRPYTCIL